MNEDDTRTVHVTAEEQSHPAIRTLARACIALARQRLQRESTAPVTGDHPDSDPADKPDRDGRDD